MYQMYQIVHVNFIQTAQICTTYTTKKHIAPQSTIIVLCQMGNKLLTRMWIRRQESR